jgi:hypothetical protein
MEDLKGYVQYHWMMWEEEVEEGVVGVEKHRKYWQRNVGRSNPL